MLHRGSTKRHIHTDAQEAAAVAVDARANLQRVQVADLRVGMFVHQICGSWLDHSFWRKSFLVSDSSVLREIVRGGVREVMIDRSKGLDVESASQTEAPAPITPEPAIAAPAISLRATGLDQEMRQAAKICATAKSAIESMFNEARMGKALDAERALPLVAEIASSVLRNPGALISIARLKTWDDYTYMHSVAVCALMVALANELGLSEEETREAGLGGLVHDLGKSAIPLEVLNKRGKLTESEFHMVKVHPAAGHKILLEGRGAGEIPLDICLNHHEKMDGTGYPNGLAAGNITLFAKMGAVCDIYDAITSNRPYKAGWDPAESLSRMAEWSGDHLDESVFQAFVKSVGIYPIGSMVRMRSGRLGIVVEQGGDSLLAPKVTVFYSTKSGARIRPELVDTSKKSAQDAVARRENPSDWDFGDLSHLWMPDGVQLGAKR